MNDQIKSELQETNFTLEGRMFFPKLLKPELNKSGTRMQYSVCFAWNFNQNPQITQQIGAFLQKMKSNLHPSVPDQYWINPIKKWGVYARQDGKAVHEFLRDCYWINASSGADFPPAIVDGMRQTVMAESEVYSGRNCIMNLSFYAIDNEKKGLGTNCRAVMLREGGDKEGGAGAVDVNSVFGGFRADMGMSSQQQQAPMQQQQAPMQQQQWPPQDQAPVQQQAPMQQQQWPPQDQTPAQQQQQTVQQTVQQTPPQNNGGGGFV